MILATFHPLDQARARARARPPRMADPRPGRAAVDELPARAPEVPWMPPELVGRHGIMSLVEWSGDVEEGRRVLGRSGDELAPAGGPVRRAVPDDADDHRRVVRPRPAHLHQGRLHRELSDGLIDALIEPGAAVGSPITQIEVLAMGGAIARVDADATQPLVGPAGMCVNRCGRDHVPVDIEFFWGHSQRQPDELWQMQHWHIEFCPWSASISC